jgi:hypothetical protein
MLEMRPHKQKKKRYKRAKEKGKINGDKKSNKKRENAIKC